VSPKTYKILAPIRRLGVVVAWLIVLYSIFIAPSVQVERFLSPAREDDPAYVIILHDCLGILLIPPAGKIAARDPIKYRLLILECVLSTIAHFYFLCTLWIVFLPSWLRVGRIICYLSVVLLFVWSYPLLDRIHSLNIGGTYTLENGYYLMGSGYMLAMCCILFNPKRPDRGPAFPVVQN